MTKPARPGGKSTYDRTRQPLSPEEQAAGWELTACIRCLQGSRRGMATCELCGGQGWIKVFNSDPFETGKPGRPKGKGTA